MGFESYRQGTFTKRLAAPARPAEHAGGGAENVLRLLAGGAAAGAEPAVRRAGRVLSGG